MLTPGPDGPRVDIFDRQISHALQEARALLKAQAPQDPAPDDSFHVDRLAEIKKACEFLSDRERVELAHWLTQGRASN
jgi:hypothetical protein